MISRTEIPGVPAAVHGPAWPWYRPDAVARAQELVARGRVFDYAHGPEIAALERAFAQRHGRRFAVAVNSGTSALLAAYVGLGIAAGDEVIVPTFTFLSCASPLFLLGAVPVLADSGDERGNLTARAIAERITPRTRAVLVTHLFGDPADTAEIGALTQRHGLAIVEDCSHAHGARFPDGTPVGTRGTVAVYSVGGVKGVTGGLGGVLLTDDEDVHDTACLLSSFKQRSRATIRRPAVRELADVGLGGNLRISPVAAVLARSHLDDLEERARQRQATASELETRLTALPGLSAVPGVPGANRGTRYGIHLELDEERAGTDRAALLERFAAHGVRITEPKTRLLHRSSLFRGARPPRRGNYSAAVWRRHFNHAPDDFPVASRLHDRWLALPSDDLHGDAAALVDAYTRTCTDLWPTGSGG